MEFKSLLNKALQAGAKDAEVFFYASQSTSLSVFDHQLDSYSSAKNQGYNLRALFNGKCGISYSEDVSADGFENVVAHAKENAEINESDDVIILSEPQQIPELKTFYPELAELTVDKAKEMLFRMENAIYAADERIESVMSIGYEYSESECMILNTLGLNLTTKNNYGFVYAQVSAKDENGVVDSFRVDVIFDENDFNEDVFVTKLVDEVVSKLSPKKMKSGNYPVIFTAKVSSSFLGALCGIFNAENIQKNLSVLKGKMDTQIFSDKITIHDDPLIEKGYSSNAFDHEGTPCFNKVLVEKGVLKQVLYNKTTAANDHTVSSGNGFKGSYAGDVGISPTNMYIEKGDLSYDELVASVKEGIIVTSLDGLHSGLNSLTTEFSLQAQGFYVKDGKVQYPISLFTVAANYMQLMNKVVALSNEVEFSTSGIGSCAILFSEIAVSGE